jgi:hypothetical protein
MISAKVPTTKTRQRGAREFELGNHSPILYQFIIYL